MLYIWVAYARCDKHVYLLYAVHVFSNGICMCLAVCLLVVVWLARDVAQL